MNEGYLKLNDALNRVFFSGKFAGRSVFLSLDNDMRGELTRSLNYDEANLENIICRIVGHSLVKKGDPYSEITDLASKWWRSSKSSAPPFTATLFCLSHAAALMAAEGDFGAHNYYQRLAQVTFIDRQTLSVYGRSTEVLWEHLNRWLIQNNYEFGRPTAKAINAWKYVGKALSQVVVRAGDRELFHDLFERYGFSGNEILSTDEIRHYLANWMTTSKPNARLKAAWENPELKDRVCESAIAELAIWSSGSGDSGKLQPNASKVMKLSLIANFVPRFPRQFLDLQLGRAAEFDEPIGPLHIEGHGQDFSLSNSLFGTFATIGPRLIGNDGGMLSHEYTFSSEDSNLSLEWHPRLIIPFAKALDGPYWIEVSRVTFGLPHLVLVRDISKFPQRVEEYFEHAAIGTPLKATSAELSGLPTGWVLYKDVQLCQPASPPSKDLEVLVPLGNDTALHLSGGLQLARGIYHSGAELTANFIASEGPTKICVFRLGVPEDNLISEAAGPGKSCTLKLSSNIMASGQGARIEGCHKNEALDSVEVLFRDSSTPRALDRQQRDLLFYSSIMSASRKKPPSDIIAVSGTIVTGAIEHNYLHGNCNTDLTLPSGKLEHDQDIDLSHLIAVHTQKETCVQKGYHYWLCETRRPEMPKRTPLRQECRFCKQVIIIVDREGVNPQVLTRRPVQKFNPTHISRVDSIDHNLLMDALCFYGCGSWGKFEALLAEKIQEPWQARSIAQDLFLLGMLDLELRAGSNHIRGWSVPPPALNFIDTQSAFLSGFRSNSLLSGITQATKNAGATFVQKEISGRPSLWTLTGISAGETVKALNAVRDPLGRSVAVVENAGMKIAQACSHLSPIKQCMSPISITNASSLELFDTRSGSWSKTSYGHVAGAYRWNEWAQIYAYLAPGGSAYQGPYQVVKLLAARQQNVRLHAYDQKKGVFYATLGCDVPGLLGRSLVACSGNLPTVNESGLLCYNGVSKNVAEATLNILYTKDNL